MLDCVAELLVDRARKGVDFTGLGMEGDFVLDDLLVHVFVEFAVVHEHVLHLFDLLHDEGVLFYERLHCDPSSNELFINGYKVIEFFVVDKFFKFLYFVL